jgi:hypothetical protein
LKKFEEVSKKFSGFSQKCTFFTHPVYVVSDTEFHSTQNRVPDPDYSGAGTRF